MIKYKRQISIVAAILLLFAGVFVLRVFQGQKKPPARKPVQKALIRTVDGINVQNTAIQTDLNIQGRLVAFDKIEIFTEVSGRLIETARPFKVGSYFSKGSTLLKIDDTEAKLALLSQKSALLNTITQMLPDLKIDYPESFSGWNNYVKQFDVKQELKPFPEPVTEQESFFVISKNIHSQFYNIKSQEERLSKYEVKAPFSGVITEAAINPGSLVRANQKMGSLMNNNHYELEATVRLADLAYVQPGNTAKLYSTDLKGEWTGRVTRVSDQIDPNTQTVFVYLNVSGPNLREGMYLRGQIKGRLIEDALEIPRDLIVDQNSVFLIGKDSTLVVQPIEVMSMTEEKAIIKGLENGSILLGQSFVGAYNGQKVIPVVKEASEMTSLK
jgi:multidrug efflux pump subunit AcrA (membrane-fusion protein)